MTKPKTVAVAVGIALVGSGSALLGHDAYLGVKAMVAERLIARAFDDHLLDGLPHRPWSWADWVPIARLDVERLGVRRHVLSGATGSSMAFGVGHIDGTALPNADGNCVLAGHRDSWFRFLERLKRGDRIRVDTVEGDRDWVVESVEVTTAGNTGILEPTPHPRLTLVTCYPFDGLVRSPWRYVVSCVPSVGDGGAGVRDVLQ
ncbi:MAG: class GN sortase [Acidobacteriota bacterium]|nr:class GN sortase [Acidobacteriota bacterium]